MAEIITVKNQKGGIGKTTVALNLARALSHNQRRVLLIDLDVTQANLSTSLLGDISEEGRFGIIHLLATNIGMAKCINETEYEMIDIIPAEGLVNGMELNIETILSSKTSPQTALKEALDEKILREYDYVLIDNPPSISQASINSLVASDYVLVPFKPEDYSIDGLKKLFGTIAKVRDSLNPGLRLLGVVLTQTDAREDITKECRKILKEKVGNLVFHTEISVNARHKKLRRENKTMLDLIDDLGSVYERVLHNEKYHKTKKGKKKTVSRNELSAYQYNELALEVEETLEQFRQQDRGMGVSR